MRVRRYLATLIVNLTLTLVGVAGTVQLLDGTVHQGDVFVDGGLLVRGTPSVKVALPQVLVARFTEQAAPPICSPGLVLTNGSRIAGSFSSLSESVVQVDEKRLRIPSSEIAWAVYHPFDVALASDLPPGKTGALLPGGDFFEGSIKNAEAKSAKVLNPIFGPRVFTAGAKDLHAIVLRSLTPQLAGFEVVTRDGSHYLAVDVIVREPGAVILRHPLYDGLRIAAGDLVEIRAAPSRVVAISSLKPSRVNASYTIARADRSMHRLGSQEVQACSISGGGSAIWNKAIRGGTFLARISAGSESSAVEKLVFIVEADGRILFRSAPVGPSDPPQMIRATVPAAESITLRVEGGAGSHGLWADPVILLR
jgi:hypothetical protein